MSSFPRKRPDSYPPRRSGELDRLSNQSDEAGLPSNQRNPRITSLRHHWSIWSTSAAFLLLALLPLPYGYYTLLRIAICLVAAWIAYVQWKHDDAFSGWVVAFGGLAILYNPLLPVHLTREIWNMLNVASAAIFLGHFLAIRRMTATANASTAENLEASPKSVARERMRPPRRGE